jgi:hypothetical protein
LLAIRLGRLGCYPTRPRQNEISNEPSDGCQPSLGSFVILRTLPDHNAGSTGLLSELCASACREFFEVVLVDVSGPEHGLHERPGRPRRGELRPARMKRRARPRSRRSSPAVRRRASRWPRRGAAVVPDHARHDAPWRGCLPGRHRRGRVDRAGLTRGHRVGRLIRRVMGSSPVAARASS